MSKPKYHDGQTAKVGDTIACGFGHCKVVKLGNGELLLRNLMTKETAHRFSSDCDLIERK